MNKNQTNHLDTPKLILASSSPYRRELLARLKLGFQAESPEIDESAMLGEDPDQLVRRLSLEKARAVASHHTDALIIGSDQAAVIKGKREQILGKPGNFNNAVKQLSSASGKQVVFLTGICLLNSETGSYQLDLVPFTVHFRKLSPQEIKGYITKEQPFNCAGSFRSEGLGIALFEKMEGEDPTALIGLPLIRLVKMLKSEGIDVLS